MKERPILFSAPMVKAILEGRKTQTRRVVKMPNHMQIEEREDGSLWPWMFNDGIGDENYWMPCPYGAKGDRLWVRERHSVLDVVKSATSKFPIGNGEFGPDIWNVCVEYCDGTENDCISVEGKRPKQTRERGETKWTPSIHMPRWASRINLEITGVRIERLLNISVSDAITEGYNGSNPSPIDPAIKWYSDLWESINGPGSWDANPWVWVIEFKVINP